jgi:hypothetical protein
MVPPGLGTSTSASKVLVLGGPWLEDGRDPRLRASIEEEIAGLDQHVGQR